MASTALPVTVERMVTARRALVEWHRASRVALHISAVRLPKSHPLSRALTELCADRTWGEFRYHADLTCCILGDILGDEHFRCEMDGVALHFPTDWFYGRSLSVSGTALGGSVVDPQCPDDFKRERTKAVSLAELSHFQGLGDKMQRFMDCVLAMPPARPGHAAIQKRLAQCAARFWAKYAIAMRHLKAVPVDHRQTYRLLLCLRRVGVPRDLERWIVGFLA